MAGKSFHVPSASYSFTYDGGTSSGANKDLYTFFRIKDSMGVPVLQPNQAYVIMSGGGILELVLRTVETYLLQPGDNYVKNVNSIAVP